MLVWKATPSTVPMIAAIFLLAPLILSTVLTTWLTTWPPRCTTADAEAARWLACAGASALWRTLLVSWAIELAVCCRLLAACAVRWLRSRLPAATSALATWTDSAA